MFERPAGWGVLALALAWAAPAQAQGQASIHMSVTVTDTRLSERSVSDWLMRMHDASGHQPFIGTFVVTSAGSLSSARIWHACDGEQQVERVQTLTGTPRSTFRRNDQVITFLPDSRVAYKEKRSSLGMFPNLLSAGSSGIPQFYGASLLGSDRIAGVEADVVQLQPKDNLRLGYRIWTEKRTGLVVKMQTLDVDGRILEQAAFSELQLDAPVSAAKLLQMMAKTEGYRVETPEMALTDAAAEGWLLKNVAPGFKPISCYRRPAPPPANAAGAAALGSTMQCIFSDGLASVSLFAEAYDPRRHTAEGALALGATQTLTRRAGDWWITAVGEVPMPTLVGFAQGLERKK
jgi:sigma-E factor negative regulatory protein RseB